jgi:hypothetical protein
MRLYISFVAADEKLVREIDKHLIPAQRSRKIAVWYRGKADLGGVLTAQADREIGSADIVLAILSASYNANDDCANEVLAARQAGKRVIPIIAESVRLKYTAFDGVVALPRDLVPISLKRNLDAAIVEIVDELWQILDKLPKREELPPVYSSEPSRSILEVLPFPWSDPRAQALHERIVNAYPRPEQARLVTAKAGISDADLNWSYTGRLFWSGALDVAANSKKLVGLLTAVLADPLCRAYWADIRAAIAPMTLP